MLIETIGNYQVHLMALETAAHTWDAFFTVLRFDDAVDDFRCVVEKEPVATRDIVLQDYDAAIEAARRAAKTFIERDTTHY